MSEEKKKTINIAPIIGYFIKPIPKEAEAFCEYPKCRNKGWWNIQNGKRISCDKHLLSWIKKTEGTFVIVNKSLKTLMRELDIKE